MIRLKYKIAIPFVAIITIVPLMTLLVFNLAMHSYMLIQSKTELRNTVESTKYLLKQEIDKTLPADEQGLIPPLMNALSTALKASRLATDTEVLLFTKDYRRVYPEKIKPANTILSDALASELQKALPQVKPGEILQISVKNSKYLAISHVAKQLPYVIVFISSMNEANALIRRLNMMLIIIMAVAAAISSAVALLLSGSISKPIYAICGFAKRIGKSDFVTVPLNRSSKELFELSNSMNDMSASLSRYDKAQRTFMQDASHELRTPLMSIQGYAEGIQSGVFADNVAAAQVISDESKRLTTLVEELLVLSRIENRTYGDAMMTINLPDIIKDFVQRMNGLALKMNKQLAFTSQFEQILVEADENLLSQSLVNIAGNCLRHAKTRVTIDIYKDQQTAYIQISDDGSGITEKDLPHIFERFYKGKGGNFGLGLSIAMSAINSMKGDIEARNTDSGALFVIRLPLL